MLFATILALASAGLHAGWNLRIKASSEPLAATAVQFAFGGLVYLPLLVLTGLPERDVLVLLAMSTLIHVFYLAALIRSYATGDFSMAYPLARGGGAMIAAIGGIAFLGDDVPPLAAAAMIIVGIGLASLVRPGTPLHAIGWGALTAVLIGSYTLVDSAGARDSGVSYAVAIGATVGLAFNIAVVAGGRGPAIAAAISADWPRHLAAGVCSHGAYLLVLIAVNYAPLGYVATLRESSVVLGAALAWWLLRERLAVPRIASSALVAAGMVMLIAARP
jgi:drug/metabolite transporter (DMT)-like permease